MELEDISPEKDPREALEQWQLLQDERNRQRKRLRSLKAQREQKQRKRLKRQQFKRYNTSK